MTTSDSNGLAVYEKERCVHCGGGGLRVDDKATGKRAREWREERQLSQEQVARSMGISASYLSDLERGKRTWGTELLAAAKAALKV